MRQGPGEVGQKAGPAGRLMQFSQTHIHTRNTDLLQSEEPTRAGRLTVAADQGISFYPGSPSQNRAIQALKHIKCNAPGRKALAYRYNIRAPAKALRSGFRGKKEKINNEKPALSAGAAHHWPGLVLNSIFLQQRHHLFPLWHGADGALFRGDQVGRRVGKAQHHRELLRCQALQAVFQHEVQHRGAEGVSRAGGLNGAAQLERRDEHRSPPA